jgi:hypothetical protein
VLHGEHRAEKVVVAALDSAPMHTAAHSKRNLAGGFEIDKGPL